MRRVLLMCAGAILLLIGLGSAPVRAAEEWCDTDPLVLIVTPGGAVVPVYVTTGALGTAHQPATVAAVITYSARPTGDALGTIVQLSVAVPDDAFGRGFATRTVASTGPLGTGTIYGRASGASGGPMALTFTLDTP